MLVSQLMSAHQQTQPARTYCGNRTNQRTRDPCDTKSSTFVFHWERDWCSSYNIISLCTLQWFNGTQLQNQHQLFVSQWTNCKYFHADRNFALFVIFWEFALHYSKSDQYPRGSSNNACITIQRLESISERHLPGTEGWKKRCISCMVGVLS